MSREKIKVLIVEDEKIPATYLKGIIEEDNDFIVVNISASAQEALEGIKKYKPQLIFMDIMIKGPITGAELALKIYTLYEGIKIIFLTAFSDEEMIEYATEAKAAAYLLKPYRPKEIKAALSLLKPALKNIENIQKDKIELKDGFVYSFKEKLLFKEGAIVNLTPKEMELLNILCKNTQRVLAKEAIIKKMNISESSLRTLIYRLRKHLKTDLISTSKKLGYRILTKE